jgi:preprotein translocase subunit SecG
VLLVYIDYAFIIVFFVLLAALLLPVARQKPATVGAKTAVETQSRSSRSPAEKVTYGLILLLFVLLFAVTWISERKLSHAHASKSRLL